MTEKYFISTNPRICGSHTVTGRGARFYRSPEEGSISEFFNHHKRQLRKGEGISEERTAAPSAQKNIMI